MSQSEEREAQDGPEEISRRLRMQRPQASSLELDRIKTRAMARARSSKGRGAPMRSRVIVALATVGLMAAGTGGVVAAGGGGSSAESNSVASSQYKPPKCTRQHGCKCPKGSEIFGPPGNQQCACPPGRVFKGNHCTKSHVGHAAVRRSGQ
jgi:hypothetical protein